MYESIDFVWRSEKCVRIVASRKLLKKASNMSVRISFKNILVSTMFTLYLEASKFQYICILSSEIIAVVIRGKCNYFSNTIQYHLSSPRALWPVKNPTREFVWKIRNLDLEKYFLWRLVISDALNHNSCITTQRFILQSLKGHCHGRRLPWALDIKLTSTKKKKKRN